MLGNGDFRDFRLKEWSIIYKLLDVIDCIAVLILGLSKGMRQGGMVVKILFERSEFILTRVFGSFLLMKKEQMYRAMQNVIIR